MRRRSFLTSSAAMLGASTLAPLSAQDHHHHHHHRPAASLMSECANRLLAALDENQRGRATFPFDTDERMNWHFIPDNTKLAIDTLGVRKGLTLRDMSPYQRHLAGALLAAGLSQTGYIKAVTIMSLEEVLRVMEGDAGEHRNPEKYYLNFRHALGLRRVGIPRRRPSRQPELHRGGGQSHWRPKFFRG